MRIDRFVIRHYGPLEPRTLDFSAGAAGLHVVYGGNEWGKSLSLQALEHGLFSPPKKIDGFSDQDMTQLELELMISQRTADAAPQRLAFRRLGQKLTSTTSLDLLDERQVLAFLGGNTLDSFRHMYGLSAERIRDGGRLLQKAKGDIATALFAAATGLEKIRDVAKSLEARQGKLFLASGNATNPRLNVVIRAMRQSFAEYSSMLQLPQTTAGLESRLAEKQRALAAVEEELRRLAADAAHHNRVRTARSAAAELHAARQRLAELDNPRLLPETYAERLRQAREQIARSVASRDQLHVMLAAQRDRRDDLLVDDRVCGAAADIHALVASTEELVGIDQDLPKRIDEIERFTRANATLFAEITATTGAPLRETAVRAPATHKQIEDLITAHGGIVTACDQREARVKECKLSLDRTRTELEGLPAIGDVADADRRVQAVREGGDLEKHLAAQLVALGVEEGDYEAECGRLQGRRSHDPVEELRVPTLAEVTEHRDTVRRLENERGQNERNECELREQIAIVESQIALCEQQVNLPADDALENARRTRDAAITAAGNDIAVGPPAPAETQALFAEIARLVRESDTIVDHLLTHADRASQRRQHRSTLERLRGQVSRLRSQRDEIDARVAAAEKSWIGLWEASRVTPGSPAAMEAWLSIHAACCTRAAGLRRLRSAVTALQKAIDTDRACLAGVLADLGVAVPANATRKHLLAAAGDALAALHNQAAQRQRKVEQEAELQLQLPRLEELLDEEIKKRDSWNTRWADCMSVLDQPHGVSTDTGRFLLDTMRAVTANETALAAARERVAAMESRRAEILDVMRRVCVAIDRPFDPRAVREIGRAASDRLHASQSALAARERLDGEIRDIEQRMKTTETERVDAEAVLRVLREESGAAPGESLDDAWSRSQRFRAVLSQADDWSQKFLSIAGDRDSEGLFQECIGTSQDEIEGKMTDIDRSMAAQTTLRDQLRDDCNELARQVDSLGGDKVARAWAECRMHEAEVLERVAEYLPLRLASLALERASRRYRDEHHAPVLARASGLFVRITKGNYAAIRLAENDIYAVRADSSTESVFQRHMSEGTRDQLYLALRLAALQHGHEQGAEPLPLVLDDGLVQFDDDRTAAMLEVLADVSSGMQVIVFTHHRSVVTAARALQATRPDAVFLHGAA